MIGIIPAAGTATRIHGLPKYLLPVGDSYLLKILIDRMKLVTDDIKVGGHLANHHQLDQYAPQAEVYQAFAFKTMTQTVLSVRDHLHFLETLKEEYNPDCIDIAAIFGMPDTYFEDDHAFAKLAAALDNGADVAVGVFYARPNQHKQAGMVAIEDDKVTEVVDKPETTDKKWLWGCLAWKPAFWDCLQASDPHVGYGIPRAIERGLNVQAVKMLGQYWDCGTPQGYYDCILHTQGYIKLEKVETF